MWLVLKWFILKTGLFYHAFKAVKHKNIYSTFTVAEDKQEMM